MIALGFDTCFSACSVAILELRDGGSRLRADLCEPMSTGHAERLVPMIGKALQHAGLSLDDVDRIVVTHGPGTFTGTRIGVACARGLALTRRLPLVAVTSLEVMARSSAIAGIERSRLLAVAMRTGRDDAYVQLFDSESRTRLGAPELLNQETAALAGGTGPVAYAGSAAPDLAARARSAGRDALCCTSEIQTRIADILPYASELQGLEVPLRPLYLRPPDAKPQSAANSVRVL
jgi:tRNA threonylcarbamoyladenosine biosynthesis protein TsaB